MTIFPSSVDWVRIASDVVLDLLGEPTVKKPNEWRYGNKGSLVFKPDAGTWFDFENDTGGGIAELIRYTGHDVKDFLKRYGYDGTPPDDSLLPLINSSGGVKSSKKDKFYTDKEMWELKAQSVISLRYPDNFTVMRFPTSHPIKQKYAPFTKVDDNKWCMKRPSGSMPIYFENKYPDKPILVNEGEKATVACEQIYKGDAVTWHGGVNAWDKSDWSPIYGREVYIFPDNDKAGFECAEKIQKHLKKNGCKVKVVQPPENFNEKDDLYDALERGDFANSEAFESYIENNIRYIPNNEFELLSYDEMEANDRPPEWLIDKIAEKETVVSIYAEPKAGKSFIGISMMLSIATGLDWYGHKTKESGVLYFCGEGEKSIFKRILAWEDHFNKSLKDAKFRVSNRPARILDDEDYEDILEKSHDAKKQFGKLGLIIIDTLQRNFGGGDENSTSDMNNFIGRIDRLKFETGACIMLIHHTGHAGAKSNGMRRGRGSSVLPASVDAEFYIERKDKTAEGDFLGVEQKVMYVKMTQTLNKEDMNMPILNFRMDTVNDLGKNKDKKSAVLVRVEDDEMPSESYSDKPTDMEEAVLDVLYEQAMKDNPTEPESQFYLQADLEGLVMYRKKQMGKDCIKDRLKALKNKGMVYHIPYKGYQHIDFKNLAPKFD